MSKVVIIGAGASGIIAALKASEKNEVILLESSDKCGKKILLTGNGKCNYWNNNIAGQSTFYIPTIQFVCVYKAGFWHVGASGIYYTGNDFASKEIKGVFVPEGGKYRGYFNDTIHLIQR